MFIMLDLVANNNIAQAHVYGLAGNVSSSADNHSHLDDLEILLARVCRFCRRVIAHDGMAELGNDNVVVVRMGHDAADSLGVQVEVFGAYSWRHVMHLV